MGGFLRTRTSIVHILVLLLMLPGATHASITVYGRANLSTDYLDDGQRGALNVSSNSSLLGFRGETGVTGSLTVTFQLEQAVRFDNAGGTFASRDSFLGISGRSGTLRLGYFDTPLKTTRARVDMFGNQLGDNRNLARLRDEYSGGDYDFDTRLRNGIHYRSPAFNNMVLDLHYSTNTDSAPTTNNNNDAVSVAITWQTEDSFLSSAFERKNDTGSHALRVAGRRSFGGLGINGFVQSATVRGSTLDVDQSVNTYGVAASYQLAPGHMIKSQYYWNDADGEQLNAQMLAIGYDRLISPELRVQASLAYTVNDDNARYSVSKGGHGAHLTPDPGDNPYGISVGIRYEF